MSVTFFFDPACPWTWVTSRWLVSTAAREHFEIEWRSFSLPYEHDDDGHPDVVAAHRVIEALREAGDNDGVSRFYDALGHRWHESGEGHELTVVCATLPRRRPGLLRRRRSTTSPSTSGWPPPPRKRRRWRGRTSARRCCNSRTDDHCSARSSTPFPTMTAAPACRNAVLLLAGVPEYHELKRGRRHRPDTKAG